MPIRINLLAEAQAAEDLRRRDPVKRALIIGACLVAMVAVWMASLQLKAMAENNRLANLQKSLDSHTNEYARVVQSQESLATANERLLALNRLAAERWLAAPLLEAVSRASLPGISISHLDTQHGVDMTPEIPGVKDKGRFIPGKPAATVEKVRLVLTGRDASPNPGNEQINKFKSALADTDYFRSQKIGTNNILLKNLSPLQGDQDSGQAFVLFSLECSYPDKPR